jgi:hypothetical protein
MANSRLLAARCALGAQLDFRGERRQFRLSRGAVTMNADHARQVPERSFP